jgi:transposase
MNRKEYQRDCRGFKLEAVRMAAVGDGMKAPMAREAGIRANPLRKWRLGFEEEERAARPDMRPRGKKTSNGCGERMRQW